MRNKQPVVEMLKFDSEASINHLPVFVCMIFPSEKDSTFGIKGVTNQKDAVEWLKRIAIQYRKYDKKNYLNWHEDGLGFDYGSNIVRAIRFCGGETKQ